MQTHHVYSSFTSSQFYKSANVNFLSITLFTPTNEAFGCNNNILVNVLIFIIFVMLNASLGHCREQALILCFAVARIE